MVDKGLFIILIGTFLLIGVFGVNKIAACDPVNTTIENASSINDTAIDEVQNDNITNSTDNETYKNHYEKYVGTPAAAVGYGVASGVSGAAVMVGIELASEAIAGALFAGPTPLGIVTVAFPPASFAIAAVVGVAIGVSAFIAWLFW